jgi:predicted TPR repeat methyltransferase
MSRDDWEGCRTVAIQLLRVDMPTGERATALFALGFAEERVGRIERAKFSYEEAIRLNPGHLQATRRLAWLRRAA